MASLKRLIREVHHRSLWQVLAIYVGASWMVFEIVQTVTEGLGLPEWFPPFAALLLLIGLPIVLATAFVQEGMSLAGRPDPTLVPVAAAASGNRSDEEEGVRRLFTWRNAISGGVLALALWGVVATGWYLLYGGTAPGPSVGGKSVAVIPFVNVGAEGEDEYFADGMTFETINRLSKIADLKVISRTSIMQYKGTTKNIRQIGEELGVATVVEGEVQRADDRVRINAQLIDATTDAHLWAEQYNRRLTDVFEIQGQVAQRIATALKATLTATERERIERQPTDNLEAYEFYVRGSEYLNRSYQEKDQRIALEMFSKALQLDPDFAAAHARLSRAHSWIYWFNYDRSANRLAKARAAAERALRLDPDLPDAHLAMGNYHYYGQRDYEGALAQFSTALRLQPNNSEVLAATAYVQRRLGEWEGALDNLKRAFELDPRSSLIAHQVAVTSSRMRNYDEAMRYIDSAISLSPETTELYSTKAYIVLNSTGDAEAAVRVIEEAPAIHVADLPRRNATRLWRLYFIAGQYERPLRELSRRTAGDDTTLYHLAKSELHELLGQRDIARAHYDSARVVLERLIGQGHVTGYPVNEHCLLGIAYAGLGRKGEALGEGRACVEQLPLSRDALYGAQGLEAWARIYAGVGEPDSAVALLDSLLSIPSQDISVPRLRVDPIWDPLRDHPRFQALLAE